MARGETAESSQPHGAESVELEGMGDGYIRAKRQPEADMGAERKAAGEFCPAFLFLELSCVAVSPVS